VSHDEVQCGILVVPVVAVMCVYLSYDGLSVAA
jgi:hypothetical protein